MAEIRQLLAAVQYFTRIPLPAWVGHAPAQLRGVVRYFPAVGILVGASGAAVLWLTAHGLPSPLPVILSTAATILLTGALHEDGLADTHDGLGGGATRERALEIMKDPRIGTYGTIALIVVLLLKITALSTMSTWIAMAALVSAHGYSRFCAVIVVFCGRYVGSREHSRAAPVVERTSIGDVVIAALFGVVPLALCGIAAIGASLVALALLGLSFRWHSKRLGGYTGDTLGAAQQVTEVGFYVALLATTDWALVNGQN